MFENLNKLYDYYGGIRSLFRSIYFWIAVLLAVISHRAALNLGWVDAALTVSPALVGFTIAAFAIMIAIIEPKYRMILSTSNKEGKYPIISIIVPIIHAVFIQIISIILAIVFKISDIDGLINLFVIFLLFLDIMNEYILIFLFWFLLFISFSGLLFTYYGLLLVVAAVLSIFRMQEILVDARNRSKSEASSKAEEA